MTLLTKNRRMYGAYRFTCMTPSTSLAGFWNLTISTLSAISVVITEIIAVILNYVSYIFSFLFPFRI
jgi:hypothetical protein